MSVASSQVRKRFSNTSLDSYSSTSSDDSGVSPDPVDAGEQFLFEVGGNIGGWGLVLKECYDDEEYALSLVSLPDLIPHVSFPNPNPQIPLCNLELSLGMGL